MNALNKMTLTIWELTLVRTFIYSLIVTGGALKIALAAKPWADRSGNDQIILVLELAGVQAGVMLAFVDQSIAKLQSAEPVSLKPELQTQSGGATVK